MKLEGSIMETGMYLFCKFCVIVELILPRRCCRLDIFIYIVVDHETKNLHSLPDPEIIFFSHCPSHRLSVFWYEFDRRQPLLPDGGTHTFGILFCFIVSQRYCVS
jgi:hypothetical protein